MTADEVTREELIETLHDVLNQACQVEDATIVDDESMPGGKRIVHSNRRYESGFLSAYRDGLLLLGKLGRIDITNDGDGSRWVEARDFE